MWIELHDTASDHPKILKLARDLGVPPVTSLGHIVSLWIWTLRMAPDGDLSSFDVDDIEIGARWEGAAGLFVSSCIKRQLIDDSDEGMTIHDWQSYSGGFLKQSMRKAKDRERKRETRSKPKLEESCPQNVHGQNADVRKMSTDKSRTSATCPQMSARTGQDRTGQDRTGQKKQYWDEFVEFCQLYLSYKPRASSYKSPSPRMKTYREYVKRRQEGAGHADMCQALSGMMQDPWPDRHKYSEAWRAIKDLDTIERFKGFDEQPPSNLPQTKSGKAIRAMIEAPLGAFDDISEARQ